MEPEREQFDIIAATARHYQHMSNEVRRLLDDGQAILSPCPCAHCTAPASVGVMTSLRYMATRLAQCGCRVSIPEKISQSQGEHILAAMTRTLHAIEPLRAACRA